MPRNLMVRTIGNGHALRERDLFAHAHPASNRLIRSQRTSQRQAQQQGDTIGTINNGSRTNSRNGVRVFPAKGTYRVKFVPVLPVIYENSELVC